MPFHDNGIKVKVTSYKYKASFEAYNTQNVQPGNISFQGMTELLFRQNEIPILTWDVLMLTYKSSRVIRTISYHWQPTNNIVKADCRLPPSQWETSLQSNAAFH